MDCTLIPGFLPVPRDGKGILTECSYLTQIHPSFCSFEDRKLEVSLVIDDYLQFDSSHWWEFTTRIGYFPRPFPKDLRGRFMEMGGHEMYDLIKSVFPEVYGVDVSKTAIPEEYREYRRFWKDMMLLDSKQAIPLETIRLIRAIIQEG
jgi:hypothetical protein